MNVPDSKAPEWFVAEVETVLKSLRRPSALVELNWTPSCLVTRILKGDQTVSPSDAMVTVFTKALHRLETASDPQYAVILHGLYWEGLQAKVLYRKGYTWNGTRVGYKKTRTYTYLRMAIVEFAQILWAQEQLCRIQSHDHNWARTVPSEEGPQHPRDGRSATQVLSPVALALLIISAVSASSSVSLNTTSPARPTAALPRASSMSVNPTIPSLTVSSTLTSLETARVPLVTAPAPGSARESLQNIVLHAPPSGSPLSGILQFAWNLDGPLPEGAVFDLRVCRGEGCAPRYGVTNTVEPLWTWCPDRGHGLYRWQVVIYDPLSRLIVGASSDVRQFVWLSDGNCEGQGSDRDDNNHPPSSEGGPSDGPVSNPPFPRVFP